MAICAPSRVGPIATMRFNRSADRSVIGLGRRIVSTPGALASAPPWDEAGQIQRPLPNTMLRIVAAGEREDPPPERAQSQPSLPI